MNFSDFNGDQKKTKTEIENPMSINLPQMLNVLFHLNKSISCFLF